MPQDLWQRLGTDMWHFGWGGQCQNLEKLAKGLSTKRLKPNTKDFSTCPKAHKNSRSLEAQMFFDVLVADGKRPKIPDHRSQNPTTNGP